MTLPLFLPREPWIELWLRQIHCGDSLQIMKQMPAGSVDVIVTSPPYNICNSSGGGLKGAAGKKGRWSQTRLGREGYTHSNDSMPHEEYVEWQRECLTAMLRLLPDNGAIFYIHKWRVQNGLIQDRADIVEGFPVRQIIIWQRAGGINHNDAYFLPTYEVIYLICKPNFRLIPKKNGLGDVWRIPQNNSNPHPAPFPVELAWRCIDSTEAKIILDPFVGSGSTVIAAEACRRNWIGIDISQEYCELAKKRIQLNRGLFHYISRYSPEGLRNERELYT